MSFIIWPTADFSIPLTHKDFITISVSLSKQDCWKPVFETKAAALLAASRSKVTTEGGFLIFFNRVAITWPSEFRMTIPRLASSDSLNSALSKLVLKQSWGGGRLFFFLRRMSASRKESDLSFLRLEVLRIIPCKTCNSVQ